MLHQDTKVQIILLLDQLTIFALSAGFQLTKINIGNAGNQNHPEVRVVLVTCISNIDYLEAGNQPIMQKLSIGIKNEKRDNKQCLLNTPRRITVYHKNYFGNKISSCKCPMDGRTSFFSQ